ncbi:hypothetical protein LCGC14_0437450 [marine sediment metagenome]|uniref:Uncharacterized protein n=1 Tax=marine sediment metagenome TaxID=412755 RepID=A0A0F9SSN6_9ZZZZ
MRVRENNEKNLIDFADLDAGDCFRYEGTVCIKTEFDQDAVTLGDGSVWSDMCGNMVTPVNAEVQIIN